MWGNRYPFTGLVGEKVPMQATHHSRMDKLVYRYAMGYYDNHNDACLYLVMRKNLELKNEHKTGWRLCLMNTFYVKSVCRHIWTYTWLERYNTIKMCVYQMLMMVIPRPRAFKWLLLLSFVSLLKIIYIIQENELCFFHLKNGNIFDSL